MGSTLINSSGKRVDLPTDYSKTKYHVVISKTLGESTITMKLKSAGDPKEAGHIRIAIELPDYLRCLCEELRRTHWLLTWLPLAWLERASTTVTTHMKRETVRL